VVPGLTNRWLGKVSRKIFCAFPGDYREFDPKKVIITGNPIRSQMKRLESANRDPFLIFIFGGSLGALGMNTLVLEALPYLKPLYSHLRFIHQTGEKDFERVKKAHADAGTNARVEKFIYEMAATYESASLLICRAGASTLAEIATVGRASILVPLPTAADNHQEKNADVFAKAGAAFLLPQTSSRGEDLARLIEKTYRERTLLYEMEKKVHEFARPLAAKAIVSELQVMANMNHHD
jgi:UDP-N-acetylglucosamine--N-acetylmuramyl-(pentapeptide) pyrophosphoryl-undecaprenol N-acetylglucosamine transferase